MSRTVRVEPFTIAVPDAVLAELRERISRARWPDGIAASGWDEDTDPAYLRALLAAWAEFDWRPQERALARFAHFRALIDGTWTHFIHERGHSPDPPLLVLTHGWPSSFTEHLALIPLLTGPAAHGGRAEDAFDVVVASLPGYGFSTRLAEPGLTSSGIADLWHALCVMVWATRGSARTGPGVTARLGWRHPGSVAGIHLAAVSFAEPAPPRSPAEREYPAAVEAWDAAEGAYSHVQSTEAATLAVALNDTPAGLAAWIVEKFRAWSDCGGDVEAHLGRDHLLTNLTIYWATQTTRSSARLYYEHRHHGCLMPPGTRDTSPGRVRAHRAATARARRAYLPGHPMV